MIGETNTSYVILSIIAISVVLIIVFVSTRGASMGSNILQFKDVIQNTNTIILDVRTPNEFKSGHIKGSINIDYFSGNFEQALSPLDKTKTYALVCRSGSRSAKAQKLMSNMGFGMIYNLSGGLSNKSNREQLDIVK